MRTYRFYYLDKDGAVIGYEQPDCADDNTAVRMAAELWPASAPGYATVEVWRGARLVHRREQLTRTDQDKPR